MIGVDEKKTVLIPESRLKMGGDRLVKKQKNNNRELTKKNPIAFDAFVLRPRALTGSCSSALVRIIIIIVIFGFSRITFER